MEEAYPNAYPCVLAMTQQKVQISPIGGMPLAVIIERVNDPVWQRDSACRTIVNT